MTNENTIPKIDLKLSVEMRDEFSYIEYHADGLSRVINETDNTPYALISKISIIKNTKEIVPSLLLTFNFTTDILSIDDIALPPCGEEIINLRIPFIKVNKAKLDEVNNTISSQLTITLLDSHTKNVYAISVHQFNILPICQPGILINDDYLLFAKYVTPLSSYVKGLTKKAVLHNDGLPIIAYQNISSERILKELQAIYVTLHDENIFYQNPPAKDHIV